MRRVLVLVLALTMIVSLLAGCGGKAETSGTASKDAPAKQGRVYKITISHHDPESSATGTFLKNWAAAVEKASGGRLDVQIFHGGVMGGVKETLNLVKNKTVDIGWGGQATYAGTFPLTDVVSLPLIGMKSAQHASRVMWELYDTNSRLQAEYKDFKVILVHANCTAPISFSRLKVTTADDLAHLNIRANSGAPTNFINALGATPVNVAMAELFQALQNNTVDGVLTDWHGLYSFKLYEAVKYILDVPCYTNTFYFLMNKDSYNSLPDDLKAVIDEHSGWAALDIMGTTFDDYEKMCREAVAKRGSDVFIKLSDKDYAVFLEAANKVAKDWIAKRGDAGQEIYDQTISLVKKHAK
ncbi:MAG: TRAP transporter substrate-binding protein DctP [Ignavibacteriales bacterium]